VRLLSLHQKDFCVYQRNICDFCGKQYKLHRAVKDVHCIALHCINFAAYTGDSVA